MSHWLARSGAALSRSGCGGPVAAGGSEWIPLHRAAGCGHPAVAPRLCEQLVAKFADTAPCVREQHLEDSGLSSGWSVMSPAPSSTAEEPVAGRAAGCVGEPLDLSRGDTNASDLHLG